MDRGQRDEDPNPPPDHDHADDHQSSSNPLQQLLLQLRLRQALGLDVSLGQRLLQLQRFQPVTEPGTGLFPQQNQQQEQNQPVLSEETLQALRNLALQRQQQQLIAALNPLHGQPPWLNQESQQGIETSFATALQLRLQQHQQQQQQQQRLQLSLPPTAEQSLLPQSSSLSQAALIALNLNLQQARGQNNMMTTAVPAPPMSATAPAAASIEALLARVRAAASTHTATAAAATTTTTATTGMQNSSLNQDMSTNSASPLLLLALLRQLQSSSPSPAPQRQQLFPDMPPDRSIMAALLSSGQNPLTLAQVVGSGIQPRPQQPFASSLTAESSPPEIRTLAAKGTGGAIMAAVAGAAAIPANASTTLAMADASKKQSASDQESFPEKLYRLLIEAEATGRDKVVSFTANGQHFEIHQPEIFAEEIIPVYFRHSKLSSFKRQLGLYGFKRFKEGPHTGEYHHPDFRRGHPELCRRIKRRPRP